MNSSYLIFGLLAILGFVLTLYINKINPRFKIGLASIVTLYSVIAYFISKEKSFLFISILGASWTLNSIKEYKASRQLK